LMFILFNWNIHAIFSNIRSLSIRTERFKLAKVARKIMQHHLLFGTISFVFIILNFLFIVFILVFAALFYYYKLIRVFMLIFLLLIVIISGYMRQAKATGTRRLVHLYASLTLYFLMLFHIIF